MSPISLTMGPDALLIIINPLKTTRKQKAIRNRHFRFDLEFMA